MRRIWYFVFIVMLALSLMFLAWSGLIRLPSLGSSFALPALRTLNLNRKGNSDFKAQNFQSAFDNYLKALEFDPFAPELHLNLGLTYEFQDQAEKALSSYQNAYNYAHYDPLKFAGLFNQAQLLGKGKKIDEALALYQKALAVDPTSKEVKTNIELLIQSQKGGQGQDQNKDQKDNKDNKDNKDQKDQNQKGQGKDNKDQKQNQPQDQNQNKDQSKNDQKKEQDNRQYQQNQKYQSRPFKGDNLSEGDVKKILGEIKQQEQKIRSEYYRKEVKEQPRDKDW